jgi:hypothetical protein
LIKAHPINTAASQAQKKSSDGAAEHPITTGGHRLRVDVLAAGRHALCVGTKSSAPDEAQSRAWVVLLAVALTYVSLGAILDFVQRGIAPSRL